jgi:hypothetical protein
MTSDFIDIPLASGGGGVRFFPDELPHDHVDLIDVMRAEIPPLKTWRLCAVRRQCSDCVPFLNWPDFQDRIFQTR